MTPVGSPSHHGGGRASSTFLTTELATSCEGGLHLMDGHPENGSEPDWIAAPWRRYPVWLSAYASWHLVNREDTCVRYLPLERRTDGRKAYRYRKRVSTALLERHFFGSDVGNLIALYAISKANTCRWVAVDIDQHDAAGSPEAAVRNEAYAKLLYERARRLGFAVLLLDSNGAGGFHVVVLFHAPVDSERAFAFVNWLVRDHRDHGLDGIETFPKQPRLCERVKFGNALRLFGRHHTREFWTRFWNGEEWVEGDAAVGGIFWTRPTLAEIPPEALASPVSRPRNPGWGKPTSPAAGGGKAPPDSWNRRSLPQCDPSLPLGDRQRLAREWLSRRAPAVQGRRGDEHTFKTMIALLGMFRLSPEEAYPLALDWSAGCIPPWSPEELWAKLSRAPLYVREEAPPADVDDIPGVNPELWVPRDTSPSPPPDERLAAHRGRMVETRKASVGRPGIYVDRSPPGSGKTAADLTAIRDANLTALIAAPSHADCEELVDEARARYGLPARSYPQLYWEEKTISCQFCGVDPPGTPEPDCPQCGGDGVVRDYVTCRNPDAEDAQAAGLTVLTAVCPGCEDRQWCDTLGYHRWHLLAAATPVVVSTHRRVAVRDFPEVLGNRSFCAIQEDPRDVLRPQTAVPAVEVIRADDVIDRLLNDPWFLNRIAEADAANGGFLGRYLAALADLSKRIRTAFESGDRRVTLIDLPPRVRHVPAAERLLWTAAQRFKPMPKGNAFRPLLGAIDGQLVSLVVVDPRKRPAASLGDGGADFAGVATGRRLARRFPDRGPFLLATSRNEVPPDVPVWISDATSRPERIEALAGRRVLEVVSLDHLPSLRTVEQVPLDVTKNASGAVVRSYVRGTLLAAPDRVRVGVICHRCHVREIERLEPVFRSRIAGIDYFHGGAERGSNRHHRECDFLLVVGTPRVPEERIIADLIQVDDYTSPNEDGGWGARSWTGRTADGTEVTVEGCGFSHPRWKETHEFVVRADLLQAIGRARANLPDGIDGLVFSNEETGCVLRPAETLRPMSDEAAGAFAGLLSAFGLLENSNRRSALTTAELTRSCGVKERQLQIRLKEFEALGLVTRIGTRKGWQPGPLMIAFVENLESRTTSSSDG